MKKFRYSMENILQVKLKLEDQAKIAYGNARLMLTREEEKLTQLKNKKSSYEDELRSLSRDRLDIMKIKHCKEAIQIMTDQIEQQLIAVKKAQARLEAARIRLNNAIMERKTQEKLKEKAWEAYLAEFDAEEQKEIDELNSFQYSSKSLDEEDR